MTPQTVLLALFAAALFAAAIYFLIVSTDRSSMAPKIRQALNACYDEIEFANLNHLPSSPAAALEKLSQANTDFKMAQHSLSVSQYKLCLIQANSALTQIREARKQLVISERPKPVPPSLRIISSPDNLQWMGK